MIRLFDYLGGDMLPWNVGKGRMSVTRNRSRSDLKLFLKKRQLMIGEHNFWRKGTIDDAPGKTGPFMLFLFNLYNRCCMI
jgi:hypothetical protein